MAQNQSEIKSLPDKYDHVQPYTPDAAAEPISFPTKIVLRMQPPSKTTNVESDAEDDFARQDLRHMIWDYAGNPAPASDLAGLSKTCIDITCITCGIRVIKVTHELIEKNIDWRWIEEDLFDEFECLYCGEGYTTRLDAYRKAQAKWEENSRSEMEKALRRRMYRDFLKAHPGRAQGVIADMVDSAIDKIKQQDKAKRLATGDPPVKPEVPQPAWPSKIGGIALGSQAGVEQGEGDRVRLSSASMPEFRPAREDVDMADQSRVVRRATVETEEEEPVLIENYQSAEVLLEDDPQDLRSDDEGQNGSTAPNGQPPGHGVAKYRAGKVDFGERSKDVEAVLGEIPGDLRSGNKGRNSATTGNGHLPRPSSVRQEIDNMGLDKQRAPAPSTTGLKRPRKDSEDVAKAKEVRRRKK